MLAARYQESPPDMKTLFAICTILAAIHAFAADRAPAPTDAATSIKGEILETKDVDGYTYLRLKTAAGERWAAVPTAQVKKGNKVVLENTMVMTNFESKSLNKTFPSIIFGTLAGANGMPAAGAAHGAHGAQATVNGIEDVKVAKAAGADAYTVAEIIGKRSELKDKSVTVRGKVVKSMSGIMNRTWLHLRDGSGSAADNTDDLIVTTTAQANVGDVVVAKGIVHTDRDFGSGYAYRVLVEDAALTKK